MKTITTRRLRQALYGALAITMTTGAAIPLAAMAQPAPAAQPAPEVGSGAFPALFEEDATLSDHVVYRPKTLSALGTQKLGVYVFGNGACSADGTSSRNHLLEIASHGYLAIASGFIPGSRPEPAPPPPGQMRMQTEAKLLTDAIDWAIAENSRAGSPYFNRIDTTAIAVSGFSCGGLQAIQVAADPRIKTIVVMNSGVFNEGNPIPGLNVSKSMLTSLHDSALYVLGGPTDIAYGNGTDDFKRLSGIPAALVNIPVGHGGTYMEPHGGAAADVVTAWLDWKLKGSTEAAKAFEGKDCGFCSDSRLTLERKNIN